MTGPGESGPPGRRDEPAAGPETSGARSDDGKDAAAGEESGARGERGGAAATDGGEQGMAGSVTAGAAEGGTEHPPPSPEFGDTWVYESIVGAFPVISVSTGTAVAIQLGGFELLVLALAWWYGLWTAALAGTAAVVVAAAGSYVMSRMGEQVRTAAVPEAYRRVLFGSTIEVVLGLLSFLLLVTYVFVVDPRDGTSILRTLAGPAPPAPVVFVGLLIAWDVCYRIGTSWWAAVVALWRSVRFTFDPATARQLRSVDRLNAGFGLLQLLLVPFLLDHPPLLFAVVGHVAAVLLVSSSAAALLTRRAA